MNDRSPLEYATPTTPAAGPNHYPPSPVAVLLGGVLGLFGMLMLFGGLVASVGLVREWRYVGGATIVGVVVWIVAGALMMVIAIRWIRSTTEPPGGAAGG